MILMVHRRASEAFETSDWALFLSVPVCIQKREKRERLDEKKTHTHTTRDNNKKEPETGEWEERLALSTLESLSLSLFSLHSNARESDRKCAESEQSERSIERKRSQFLKATASHSRDTSPLFLSDSIR